MEQKLLLDEDIAVHIGITGFISSAYAKDTAYNLSEISHFKSFDSIKALEKHLLERSITTLPDVLLLEVHDYEECFDLLEKIRKNIVLRGIIVVLLSNEYKTEWLHRARKLGVHDYYVAPYTAQNIFERLTFLVKFKLMKPTLAALPKREVPHYEISFLKRAFDICFALAMLILLSPILLLTAIFVRLESRGPIIYKSRRVGTGFKIFNFYKFRSMYADAEKKLDQLTTLNAYKQEGEGATFFKIKNDPRITKIGHFIRRSSIDELPQLFNVLRGDMSIVGNRPLPTYEAERLTSDEWSWRFLAPAGLTGLWQIRRRGKKDMSERERKKLDNFYARKNSFLFDFKILTETAFVFFQQTDD